MNIIVSELFLSACLTPLHCALSEDTPERKHFPQPWPQQPPTNPDICSISLPFLPSSRFHACPPLHHPCLTKLTGLHGEEVGRLWRAPHLYLKNTNLHVGLTARDPALLTEVGGYDKDDSLCGGTLSAAVTRNLFRKNRILYTIVVGVKKGGTY